MCFAQPKCVLKIEGKRAVVHDGQVIHTGNLNLKPGDYVLVFADLAVEKVGKQQALLMQKLIKQTVSLRE